MSTIMTEILFEDIQSYPAYIEASTCKSYCDDKGDRVRYIVLGQLWLHTLNIYQNN